MTPTSPRTLENLRIAVEAGGVAGLYAGWLLAGLGADVTMRYRSRGPAAHHGLVRWLARPTKAPAPGASLASIAGDSDVVIVDAGMQYDTAVRDEVATAASSGAAPISVVITPFGMTGPWAERPATAQEVCALSALMAVTGFDDGPPLAVGGRVLEMAAGVTAAIAAIAALLRRDRIGRAQTADVSMLETTLGIQSSRAALWYANTGLVTRRPRYGSEGLEGYLRCADGHIQMTVWFTPWDEVLRFLEVDPATMPPDSWEMPDPQKFANPAVIEVILAALQKHDRAHWVERGQSWRIPVLPVHAPGELLTLPHLEERRFWAKPEDGSVALEPGHPFAGAVRWHEGPAAPDQGSDARADAPPLAGVNVAEFSIAWSTPIVGELLAMLGATVVKIESPRKLDTARQLPLLDMKLRHPWYEYAANYQPMNAGKLLLGLDIAATGGAEVPDKLLGWADIALTNYAPRAVEQLGLLGERVLEVNPGCTMVHSTGFGFTGPWRGYIAYGTGMDGATGLSATTAGMARPFRTMLLHPDISAGLHQALAAVAGLYNRQRHGKAVSVDLAQLEVGLNAMAEHMLAEEMGETVTSPFRATVACAGDDEWLALTAPTKEACERLAALTGAAGSENLAAAVGKWAATRDKHEAAEALLGAGIPAAPVYYNSETAFSEHLAERDYFTRWESPRFGQRWAVGRWFRFSGEPAVPLGPVQSWGEGNGAVLHLLGHDEAAGRELTEQGAVATEPRNVAEATTAGPDPEWLIANGRLRAWDPDHLAKLGLKGPVE